MDTSVNPGNFKSVRILSAPALLKRSIKLLFKLEFRKAFNSLVSGGLNLFNTSFRNGGEKVYQCSVCHFKTPFFYAHGNDLHIMFNSICPNCNSRSRHRGLFFLYKNLLGNLTSHVSVMHFAPEPVFYQLFKSNDQVVYQTADLFLSDVDFKEDIQNLRFSDSSYDLVLCNHVIEHVPNDAAALSEMSRILKPGGKAIITIPGDFERGQTIYFNHLRYNGHYRDYGLDVVKKMRNYFKTVECVNMHIFNIGSNKMKYGIRPSDIAFICKK